MQEEFLVDTVSVLVVATNQVSACHWSAVSDLLIARVRVNRGNGGVVFKRPTAISMCRLRARSNSNHGLIVEGPIGPILQVTKPFVEQYPTMIL